MHGNLRRSPKGPIGSPRGDFGRGLSHSLRQPLNAQAGEERWGRPLLSQGRAVSLWGVTETPQPLPANPTSAPPPPQQQHQHHHTHKKIGYILNKAIRFLIRGLGCSV